MSKYSGNNDITFNVGFNVNTSELNKIKASLQEIQNATSKDLININATKADTELDKIKQTASQVEKALTKAFNPSLNTINVAKFNAKLSKTGLTVNDIYSDFAKLGSQGQTAFLNLASGVLTANTQLKKTTNLLDQMGQTMINTIKWNIASSAINGVTNAVQQAYNYVKVLDSSLTDIRIVTGDSRAEMDKFADSANSAAQALGRQTKDYTEAALTFYQQGLGDNQVKARTETTLKASNITGEDASTMADQLTAVWNGFKVSAQDTDEVVSKMAAVADSSASNMSELATAMSKVASVANNMGVDIDQLNAQIATITQVTRQAPETTGNALKTIYSRINDIKTGADGAQTSLGNYSGQMAELGINVLDANGNLRDTGDVMTQIGQKWKNMSKQQQTYLAQTMAGQRQMNNLIALFDNWDTYTKELNVSLEANNELNEKNDIYLESLSAHAKQLQAAQEGLIQAFANGDSFKGIVDIGTNLLKIITELVKSIGGGGGVILEFGSILGRVFSRQIADQINSAYTNIKNAIDNTKQLEAMLQATKDFATISGIGEASPAYQNMISNLQEAQKYYKYISNQQVNQQNEAIKNQALAERDIQLWNEKIAAAAKFAAMASRSNVNAKQLLSDTSGDIGGYVSALADGATSISQTISKLRLKISEAGDATKLDLTEDINNIEQQIKSTFDNIDNDQLKSILTPVVGQAKSDIQQLALSLRLIDTQNLNENQVAGLKDVLSSLQSVTNAVRDLGEQTIKTSNQGEEAEKKAKANADQIKQNLRAIAEYNQRVGKINKTIQGITSGAQLLSAGRNLSSITDIWSDQNISNGDKMVQIISNLAMTVPMLITSMVTLKNIFGSIGALGAAGDPIGLALGVLLTALPEIVKLIDNAVITGKQAKETLQNDLSSLQQTTSQLDNLHDQLDQNNQKIDEIQSKGKLSITDQQDIDNLKAENDLLQAQINSQKVLQDLKFAAAAKDYDSAEQKGSYDYLKDPWSSLKNFDFQGTLDNGQIISEDMTGVDSIKELEAKIQQFKNLKQEYSKSQQQSDRQAAVFYDGWIKELQAAENTLSQNVEKSTDDVQTLRNLYNSYQNMNIGGIYNDKLQGISNEIKGAYQLQGQFDSLTESAVQSAAKNKENLDRLTSAGAGLDEDQIKNALGDQAFTSLKTQADALGLSVVDLANNYIDLYNAGKVTNQVTDESADNLDEVNESARNANQTLETLNSIQDKINQKGKLSSSDLKTLSTTLDDLSREYPQLEDQINSLSSVLLDKGLVGTQKYTEALNQLQDSLSQVNFNDLKEQADDALGSIQNTLTGTRIQQVLNEGISGDAEFVSVPITINDANVQQFEQDFDDFINTQYSLDVAIETNAQDTFSDITNQFDNLQQQASKIGDSFIVAADDIASLNNAFPGILQGMTQLSDGTVQLNKEVVNSVIGSVTTETAASAQSAISRLNDEKSVLEGKRQAVIAARDQALAMLNSVQQGETVSAQDRKALSDNLAAIQMQNSDDSMKKSTSDVKDIATSADKNGEKTGQAAANAGTAISKGYAEGATSAIASLNAIGQAAQTLGNGGVPQATQLTGTTVGNYYTSTGGGEDVQASNTNTTPSGQNKTLIKGSGEALADYLGNVVDELDGQADALNDRINNINGMIAQVGAEAQEAAEGIKGVTGGSGWPDNKKSKSKSGGNKGKGGTKTPKTADEIDEKKWLDEDIDKFHQLDRAIDDVNDAIDKYDKFRDKTIRRGLSQTIDKQNAALEQQKQLYEDQSKNINEDLKSEQEKLAAQGVEFDNAGKITNYTQITVAYQKKYNDLLEQAKTISDADAQTKKINEAETVKKQYENFKKQLDYYEKQQDKVEQIDKKLQDIADKQEELRIAQFKIKIDTALDVSQAKRDWNDFKKTVIDKINDDSEDYLGQAKARLADFSSYYTAAGDGIIQQLTEHVNKTRKELEIIETGGESSIYGKNEAQALEDLKKYTDDLMQNMQDVQDMVKDIHDLYLDAIDKAQEAFDAQIDLYDQVDSIIEHDMNLITLIHGEQDYADLEKYYDIRANNNNQEIDFYRQQTEMWKQQMDAAEEGTKEWKQFRQNWMQSLQDLNSAVDDAVQNLLDKYNNTINKIIKNAKDQALGGDWDKALEEWDKAKWTDDRYLDKASRATGVLDFVDSVNEAMNKQSPKVQKELSEFLDKEVSDLNGITNLRQIDLDIANKKLQVLQKQYALEDAQNAKTKMRLRRDSQGNYTYQYVADEDEISSKQQDLRDALEQLRQLSKNDLSDTMDEMQSKLQEFFEKAQELSQKYYGDQQTLQQKLLELQNEYFGEDGYITQLSQDYNGMQSELITATGAEFSNLLTQLGSDFQSFLGLGDSPSDQAILQSIMSLINGDDGQIPTLLDGFTTGVYQDHLDQMSQANQDLLFGEDTGLSSSWNTALSNIGTSFDDIKNNVILPAMEEIQTATIEYRDDLNDLATAAGTDFEDIRNGIDPAITSTQNLISANDDLIQKYKDQVSAVQGVYGALRQLVRDYKAAEKAASDAADQALRYWAAVQGQSIDITPTEISSKDTSDFKVPEITSSSSSSKSSGSTSKGSSTTEQKKTNPKDDTPKQGTMKKIEVYNTKDGSKHHTLSTSATNSSNYSFVSIGTGYLGDKNNPVPIWRLDYKKGNTKYTAGYTKTNKWTSYDTGGYTGAWANGSKQGKLAFLHQKQMVLNAKDTKNFLSAVKIARGAISAAHDLGSAVLNNVIAGRGLSNIDTSRTNTSNMNQSITIHAEFPNANSIQTIQAALEGLPNKATQYANKNRRRY